jgi:hypothetical protein
MIDRIFIPTVHRVDNQIAYNAIPDKHKHLVTFVVQAWERPLYSYVCDYLVLPDTPEFHYSDYYCLPKTRKFIYDAGKDMKYAVIDDDIKFRRRNTKYITGVSNMEKSQRFVTDEDFDEMLTTFDKWLDEVTVVGCAQTENPPSSVPYRENTSLTSAFFVNGTHFKDLLPSLDLTSVRVSEDVCFLLSLLTNGYRNRVSEEFLTYNSSNNDKKMPSTVWDTQTSEQTLKDHKKLEAMFPGIYRIQYDDTGKRIEGGYRNHGKTSVQWSKAFNSKVTNTLDDFFG